MAGYSKCIRKDKRGGYSYKVTVCNEQYQGSCVGCTTREQALAFVAQLKADLRNNNQPLKNVPVITIGVLGEKYKQYTIARNGDIKHVRSKVKFFNEYFGENTPAINIKKSDLDPFINYCRTEKGFKDSTIDRYISALSKMYSIAIDDDVLIKNPCSKIGKLALYDQNDYKFWYEEEIKAIKSVAPLWFKDMIECALIMGVRRANIRLFNKSWIDWDRKMITVPRRYSKSRKAIPIPLGNKLKEIILRNLQDNDTEYVFINRQRRTPRAEKTMEDYLKKFCEQAGVKYYGWNGFRHTAGCRMADNGVAPQEIKEYMGHSSLLVTQKYLNRRDKSMVNAMEILESYED